jgi:thiol-disulfide isomerase/thioredoxin
MWSPFFQRPRSAVLSIFVAGVLFGCDNPSAPETGSVTDATPAGDVSETSPQDSDALVLPDGNHEPPLSDVSEAVASVPTPGAGSVSAGSGAVQLQVVSPEGFDAIIAQHKGKVVLVDFWASWCVPCRKAFPQTVDMAKKHADEGLVVVSMCFDDEDAKEDALEFLKENNATFQNLMCKYGGETESFEAYEIGDAGLPYFRVYDRSGTLKHAFKNDIDGGKGVDEAEVHSAVEALLKAKPAAE